MGDFASVQDGSPNYWLITLPLGIAAGGTLSARTAGGFWLGGEEPVRCPNLRPVTCSCRRWLDRRG